MAGLQRTPTRQNWYVFPVRLLLVEDLRCTEPVSSAATLPGMWDRTITIGSAGKTFSVTGWKVRTSRLTVVH